MAGFDVCMSVCMYVCVCIYECMYIGICIYIYMCVCVYIYIYPIDNSAMYCIIVPSSRRFLFRVVRFLSIVCSRPALKSLIVNE